MYFAICRDKENTFLLIDLITREVTEANSRKFDVLAVNGKIANVDLIDPYKFTDGCYYTLKNPVDSIEEMAKISYVINAIKVEGTSRVIAYRCLWFNGKKWVIKDLTVRNALMMHNQKNFNNVKVRNGLFVSKNSDLLVQYVKNTVSENAQRKREKASNNKPYALDISEYSKKIDNDADKIKLDTIAKRLYTPKNIAKTAALVGMVLALGFGASQINVMQANRVTTGTQITQSIKEAPKDDKAIAVRLAESDMARVVENEVFVDGNKLGNLEIKNEQHFGVKLIGSFGSEIFTGSENCQSLFGKEFSAERNYDVMMHPEYTIKIDNEQLNVKNGKIIWGDKILYRLRTDKNGIIIEKVSNFKNKNFSLKEAVPILMNWSTDYNNVEQNDMLAQ